MGKLISLRKTEDLKVFNFILISSNLKLSTILISRSPRTTKFLANDANLEGGYEKCKSEDMFKLGLAFFKSTYNKSRTTFLRVSYSAMFSKAVVPNFLTYIFVKSSSTLFLNRVLNSFISSLLFNKLLKVIT